VKRGGEVKEEIDNIVEKAKNSDDYAERELKPSN